MACRWVRPMHRDEEPEALTVRILIVDDQKPFRAAARDVIAMIDGFEVIGEAETGVESIEAAAALCPDLILMDINPRYGRTRGDAPHSRWQPQRARSDGTFYVRKGKV
jgi:hypothetical protein